MRLASILSLLLIACGAAPVPIELRPYRVQISIAFADATLLAAGERSVVLADVDGLSERWLGQMWQVSTEDNRWLLPAAAAGLDRLTPAALALQAAPFDKVLVLLIEFQGGDWVLSGREFDVAGQRLSGISSARVAQRRELSYEIQRLSRRLFSPVAAIDRVDPGKARLRLQAGDFPPPDPDCRQVTAGQLWQPLYRHTNKDQQVDRIQQVPWTYLKTLAPAENVDRTRVDCEIVSGLRMPLTNRRSLRIEALAVAVQPAKQPTTLRLFSRNEAQSALAGFEVDVSVGKEGTPARLLSNRAGEVQLLPSPEHPLIWLTVRSGQISLARLPYVPGCQPRELLDLPDDSIRLRVEGEVSVLQARLMDAVAQWAMWLARMRATGLEGNWEEVDKIRQRLKELPDLDAFRLELAAIQLPAVKAARQLQDRATVSRVEKVCRETDELLAHYLSPDKLRKIEEELSQLRTDVNADSQLKNETP